MNLYQTDAEDVAAACDRFSRFAKPGNQGRQSEDHRLEGDLDQQLVECF